MKLPVFLLGGSIIFFISKKSKSANPNDLETGVNIATGGALTPVLFFKEYYPFAQQSQQSTGVPALVTLAQAAIESGYGKHVYGNNFFGIKASASWTGEVQKLKTWECGKTGNPVTDGIKDEIIQIFPKGATGGFSSCPAYSYRVYGKFRKYSSPKESFIDHGNFLKNNSRYSKAFNFTDPNKFALEVSKAGYSTNPNYGTELVNLITKIKTILGIGK